MGLRQTLGNLLDRYGTYQRAPELNLSELIAGGPTVNTAQAAGTVAGASTSKTLTGTFTGSDGYLYNQYSDGTVEKASGPVAAGGTDNLSAQTTSSDGSGDGSTPYVFQPTSYNGVIYYTPEDLKAAVDTNINDQYNEGMKKIEASFKAGFLTIDDRDAEIKQLRTKLVQKKADDLQSVSGYFNSISPDAIQSQQNTYNNKAVKSYNESNASLGSALGSTLYDANGNIRQDLTTADLQPYMNENSDTGRLARNINDFIVNYGAQKQAQEDWKTGALDSNANNYIQQLMDKAGTYSGYANTVNTANTLNLPSVTDYSNYLNSNLFTKGTSGSSGVAQAAITKKVDQYGNPIDEYVNQ